MVRRRLHHDWDLFAHRASACRRRATGRRGCCSAAAAREKPAPAPNGSSAWRCHDPKQGPIALIGETEHDAREVMVEGVSGLLAAHEQRRTAGLDSLAPPAGMAQRRGGAGVFRRGSGKFARAAIRGRLVRRACQVASCRSHVRYVAVRAAPWRAAAAGHHDHAAADRADQAADRRSEDRGDAGGDRRQRAPSGAGVSRRGGRPLCRHAGSAARSSTARSSRSAPTRCGRAAASRVAASTAAPPLQRIVVAVDPPASASEGADACGLVAAGRAEDGTIYVIADETARAAFAGRLVAPGHRAVAQAFAPTRWWSRSTRAATWCAR